MKHIITTLFILVTISAFAQEKVEKNYQLEDPIKELKVNGFNDVVFVLAEEYSVTVEYYNGEGFGARLKNSGTGIAKIQAYKISKDGKVFSDWIEILKYLYPKNTTLGYNVISANYIDGDMILPAEEVTLFEISWADAPPKMEEVIRSLDFEICYASLLKEYWILENGEQKELTRPCEVE